METKKTATLLPIPGILRPKRFFVRCIEENGECFESGDYNQYKEGIKKVVAEFEERGYTVINNLGVKSAPDEVPPEAEPPTRRHQN